MINYNTRTELTSYRFHIGKLLWVYIFLISESFDLKILYFDVG